MLGTRAVSEFLRLLYQQGLSLSGLELLFDLRLGLFEGRRGRWLHVRDFEDHVALRNWGRIRAALRV